MKGFTTLLFLIVLACVIAGAYGIVNDQFTYTISPEYYTKFKFEQFRLAYDGMPVEHHRFYVSIVGLLATWWIGIPIGLILGIFSWQSDRKKMLKLGLTGFLIALCVAFASGLIGLYWGYHHLAHLPREHFNRWFIPGDLVDFRSFIAVGSMHNESYMGGLYGLFAGIAYIGFRKGIIRLRQNRSIAESTTK